MDFLLMSKSIDSHRNMSMHVGFARPDVDELVLHLYGRSVHPELFDVYARSELRLEGFTVDLRLCDAGHVIEFRHAGGVLTEVASTGRHPLPNRKRMIDNKLHGNRDECHDFECGLRYQVSYQVEYLDPEVYLNFHEELLGDCRRAAVAFCFPPGNRFSPCPISLIRREVYPDSLLVHAFHTFPDSCAVVKTQSLFEMDAVRDGQ